MVARVRYKKPIHCYEQLDIIDNEEDPIKKSAYLKQFGSMPPCNFILSLNFNHTVKLELPEGMPPLDVKHMDQSTDPDFMGLLASSISKLRHCSVKSDLKPKKKENIFYDVLVNCPMKDAEIICSAKDHALEELYPTITAEFVASVFPSYVKDDNAPV